MSDSSDALNPRSMPLGGNSGHAGKTAGSGAGTRREAAGDSALGNLPPADSLAYSRANPVADSPTGVGTTARAVIDGQVLAADGVVKRVSGPDGDLTILHGVDLSIRAGDAAAIVGPSGSGKSTLLGILAGLDSPSEGIVTLLDHDLATLDEDGRARLRAGRVGFVFQNFQLLPGLTALENVMLPLELSGIHDAAGRARAMLGDVGLAHREGHHPLQLSGGEQQRVALARAFVSQPALLFADEPTGNLDAETGRKVVDLMFSLRERLGSALVLVTHDNTLAERCDRRLRMDAGRLADETRRAL